MQNRGRVQTVLGAVAPEDLGITLPHEHVLSDLLGPCRSAEEVGRRYEPAARQARAHEGGYAGALPIGIPASYLGRWDTGITLQTYSDVAKNWVFHNSMYRLLDVDDAIEEVMHFKRAGGGCIVDQTSIGMARDPVGLQRVSRATGLHIVMVTGYYVESCLPPDFHDLSEDAVSDRILGEIEEGVAWGVKPGMVGEIGLCWPVSPQERKSLRASARAATKGGLPLSIHPGGDPHAAMDALRTVEEVGGDISHTVMCHVEARGLDHSGLLELARTGCYVEFDLFGRESTAVWSKGVVEWPNDAIRLNLIATLAEHGHEKQILVSHDHAGKMLLHKWGGVGYDHIVTSVVPLMRHKGFANELIARILVHNPAEMLTARA